jgi:ubiquinone/menaquinone biosynthesis C-methylase UbiE
VGWCGAGDTAHPSSARQQQWDAHFAHRVDDWEKIYEDPTLSGAIHQLRRAIALQWFQDLTLPADARVLEVGCGAGVITVALAQLGHVVDALDRVPGMVERTRQLAARTGVSRCVTPALGDAQDLTFPTNCFQCVLALGVILFLDRPQQALAEIARVLKPGGYALVNSHNRWRLQDLLDPLRSPPLDPARGLAGTVLRRLGLRRRAPYTGPVARLFSNSEFDAMLRGAGLEKVRAMSFGFGPFSFLGQLLFADSTGVRLHRVLQRLASGNVPLLRSAGAQYIVLARKVA